VYIRSALAPGTRATYNSAVAAFRRWRVSRKILRDGPISSSDCAAWLAQLADEGRHCVATLKVYSAALSTTWEEELHPDDEARNPVRSPQVRRVLRGIANDRASRRRAATKATKAPRSPSLTFDVLCEYRYDAFERRDVMLLAAAMLGVTAALRPSELLGSSRYPERALTCGQVRFYADELCTRLLSPAMHSHVSPRAIKVRVLVTKTSQHQAIEKVVSAPIAIAAVWRWCRHRGARSTDPLFWCNGKALTTRMLVGDLNRRHVATTLPPLVSRYTGKCLRRGGTSTLAARGVARADIAALGWAPNSHMWELYANDPGVQHARRVVIGRLMQLPSPSAGDADSAAPPSRRI
jgi:hypothetical protein